MVGRMLKRIVEAMTKQYFLSLVRKAYQEPFGKAHGRIVQQARIWFGFNRSANRVQRAWAKVYVDFALQARVDLFRRKELHYVLPDAPIGFEDLRIHCSCADSNSSFVYLLGFTDNIVVFDLLKKHVPEGTVSVDVGANIGVHSLVMSRCVGRAGKVISFEPLDIIHERLLGNVALNGLENIEARMIGISDRRDELMFDSNLQDFNIGKGRISPAGTKKIVVSTLDHELRDVPGRISLVKIDIEGHELQAILGGQKILSCHKPAIICEFNPQEYDFGKLRKAVPFPAKFYKIPVTFADQLSKLVNLEQRADILILPQ